MKPIDPAEIARKDAEARAARAGLLRYMHRAERITRILCRRSGAVDGFVWRKPSSWARGDFAKEQTSFRTPPLPFHSFVHKGSGWCRVCGQAIYARGSCRSFAGPQSKRLTWHNVCTSTYFLMTKPSDYAAVLIHRQGEACAISGAAIMLPYSPNNIDVDHEVPLFRVARDHADEPWYELIRFWGFGNLRAVTHAAHLAKNADEAKERSRNKAPTAGQADCRFEPGTAFVIGGRA